MATTQMSNNKRMVKQLGSIQFVGYYVAIKNYVYEDFNDKWNFYDKKFLRIRTCIQINDLNNVYKICTWKKGLYGLF